VILWRIVYILNSINCDIALSISGSLPPLSLCISGLCLMNVKGPHSVLYNQRPNNFHKYCQHGKLCLKVSMRAEVYNSSCDTNVDREQAPLSGLIRSLKLPRSHSLVDDAYVHVNNFTAIFYSVDIFCTFTQQRNDIQYY